ncbi:MAG TPA: hypothetical protein VFB62_18695 [Polyangiaceae bacterium]|nr:hypothetical protein [Polyangiaceae bacterium]
MNHLFRPVVVSLLSCLIVACGPESKHEDGDSDSDGSCQGYAKSCSDVDIDDCIDAFGCYVVADYYGEDDCRGEATECEELDEGDCWFQDGCYWE